MIGPVAPGIGAENCIIGPMVPEMSPALPVRGSDKDLVLLVLPGLDLLSPQSSHEMSLSDENEQRDPRLLCLPWEIPSSWSRSPALCSEANLDIPAPLFLRRDHLAIRIVRIARANTVRMTAKTISRSAIFRLLSPVSPTSSGLFCQRELKIKQALKGHYP